MDSLLNVSRRSLVKWGLLSAGAPMFAGLIAPALRAQDAGSEAGSKGEVGGRSEEELFPAKGLPGGGQLEIRLTQTLYTSDPDQLEVAQRMKPFNLESWIVEWTRVAERNEKLAEEAVAQGYKQTANNYYLRASTFYREAAWPQPVTEPRMLPTYNKMRDTFAKAWQQTKAPFEKVQINYEGKMLDGYFRKPNGPAGTKYPAVIPFEGADTMMEATIQGGAAYVARGMAYLAVDFPGQGGALRLKDMHLPPDTDRVIKAMIDYLETRQDVDASKIGLQGISMGGYGVPRAAAGESRVKVAMMSSGSYDLGADLFDYYPPIQERVRWIIGAKDLTDARKKLKEYTLEGKATRIECPMLIGYSKDDRIMDPAGAFRLYKAATNSKRDMVEGTGHAQASNAGGPREMREPIFPDWAMKQLVG
ncbi:MAG TPA: alpha/beta hydrolase [Candidatus Acidoferrales bacterium]|jgi:dienelactone hydrolase|nr:alpha/beta hydrolase [Candidatus Acidoferrales bacterium]